MRAARLVDDFFVPGPLQETALQLVTAAAWPRHLRALRVALRRNRDLLAGALLADPAVALDFALPSGGLHLWVRLPEGKRDEEVAARAAAQGIIVIAGRHSFPAEPPAPYLRLSYATVEPNWVEAAGRTVVDAIGTGSGPS